MKTITIGPDINLRNGHRVEPLRPIKVAADIDLTDVPRMVVTENNETSNLHDQIRQIDQKVKDLHAESKTLLGIEQERQLQIKEELKTLSQRRTDLQQHIKFLVARYTNWIPLNPLYWRDAKTNLPVFALFDVNSPDAYFSAFWDVATRTNLTHPNSTTVKPDLEGPLLTAYDDVMMLLRTVYKPTSDEFLKARSITVKLSVRFSGTIPASTREKISRISRENVFTKVFILAEVKEWNVEKIVVNKPVVPQVRTLKTDPLVVGWTRFYPDKMWYIDAFDITPLENQIPIAF